MTLRAVGFGPRFPRAWLLPITAMVLLLAVAVTGRLSRSIVADLAAWWPVWLGLGLAAYGFRGTKAGPIRVAGVIPLVALVVVLVFAWAHLSGWAIMPSAAQYLSGPSSGEITDAEMIVGVDGEVRLGGGSEFLYEVGPIRRGGSVGIPSATEVTTDGSSSVTLIAPSSPGVYVYTGWDVRLSSDVAWALEVEGAVDADLTSVDVTSLTLAGAGSVSLGPASDTTPVTVTGDYGVTVPTSTPVRVVGVASVPAGWTLTDDGAVSPGLGTGWILTVVGEGSLTIRER